MNENLRFKIKTYLIFLLIEPWTSKFRFPNMKTFNWFLLILSAFFKWELILIFTITLGIIFNIRDEWRSGKFISWYRIRSWKKYGQNTIPSTEVSADEIKDNN